MITAAGRGPAGIMVSPANAPSCEGGIAASLARTCLKLSKLAALSCTRRLTHRQPAVAEDAATVYMLGCLIPGFDGAFLITRIRMRYGTNSTRLRHNDGGSSS